jgi:hypothetical protein
VKILPIFFASGLKSAADHTLARIKEIPQAVKTDPSGLVFLSLNGDYITLFVFFLGKAMMMTFKTQFPAFKSKNKNQINSMVN